MKVPPPLKTASGLGHRSLLWNPQGLSSSAWVANQTCRWGAFQKHCQLFQGSADSADRIGALLGTEHDLVLAPLHPGADPRELAAACGTLRAGGLLVLGTPGRSDLWSPAERRFLRLVASYTHPDPEQSTLRWLNTASTSACVPGKATESLWRRQQDAVLERLTGSLLNPCAQDRSARVASDPHADITLVLGARGRGKSALLGRLAATLSRHRQVSLCAGHVGSVRVLQRHATQSADADETDRSASSAPPFVRLDQALRKRFDVLMVDEAAEVPLPVLMALAGRCRHLLLATTTQGYEGSGRAFALRLPALLAERGHRLEHVRLEHPVRWRCGDPLEALMNEAFLLADTDTGTPADQLAADRPAFRPGNDAQAGEKRPNVVTSGPTHVPGEQLLNDEALLRRLYGLLLQAHYRTSPIDLYHLLDQPGMLSFVWPDTGNVQAAALVALEGHIPSDLHAAIGARQRRPAHQILPQLLAQSSLLPGVAGTGFARIVRIAVAEPGRRTGLGSELLAGLRQHPRLVRRVLGTSFGAEPGLLDFWTRNGFVPFHRGFRRNPRSGLHSVAMLDAAGGDALPPGLARASALLLDNLQALDSTRLASARLAATRHQDLDALQAHDLACQQRLESCLRQALERLPEPAHRMPDDRSLLNHFARGERSGIDSAGALLRLADSQPAWLASTHCATTDELRAWLAGPVGVGSPGRRSGRGRQEAHLRAVLASWLA